jgi:hypothetical protein
MTRAEWIADLEQRVKKQGVVVDRAEATYNALKRQLGKQQSLLVVETLGLTKDKVQALDEPGVPWLGCFSNYGEWLAAQPSPKPYAEWNGEIYRTEDIIAGRILKSTGANLEDVP